MHIEVHVRMSEIQKGEYNAAQILAVTKRRGLDLSLHVCV